MASLSEQLACLSNAASQLNKSTNGLTLKIEALEKDLAAMNVGIEDWLGVCLPLSLGGSERVPYEGQYRKKVEGFDLGYCKIGSSWRIAVKKVETFLELGEPGDFEEVERFASSEPSPLVNASRAVRARASLHFEELISSLIKAVGQARRRIESGRITLDGSLSSEQAAEKCSESSESAELQDQQVS